MNPRKPRRIRRPDPDDIAFARALRAALTDAERLLWDSVRNRRLNGFKFRRQHPLGPFCVDFYCAQCRLAVELDGAAHLGRDEYDLRRQRWLEEHGVRVLRFSNDDVELRLREVLDAIGQACANVTW